jgi:hypothetical protein
MEIENTTLPEVKKKTIEVRYEGLDSKDSLIQVDGVKLAETLRSIGYTDKNLVPLEISGKKEYVYGGHYDRLRGKVVVNQEAIINQTRIVYKTITEFLESESGSGDSPDKSWWQKVQQGNLYKKLWPGLWPYKLTKQQIPYYAGNADRRNAYLWAAKEGTLKPELSREDQMAHALKFYEKQLQRISQRHLAHLIGHEYEHGNKKLKKLATTVGIALTGYVASFAAFVGYANAREDITPAEVITGLFLVGAGTIAGSAKGAALDEDASIRAEIENMNKIVECFHISEDVFNKRILNKQ